MPAPHIRLSMVSNPQATTDAILAAVAAVED
jgi:hypothetical protein